MKNFLHASLYIPCLLLILLSLPSTVKSQVVVNEILASNASYGSDEMGQFNDWVELYNNASFAVSLNGFFFTDSETNLTKWPFPNVSIGGQSYLIIWCDGSPEQGPMHTPFKLSAGSEFAYLVNPLGEIVDGTSYPEQQTDISLGRYPNGIGPYTNMMPTFNASNSAGINTSIDPNKPAALSVGLYPNPSTTDAVVIDLSVANVADPVHLRLCNAMGQVVKQINLGYAGSGSTETQVLLPLEQLSNGWYVVELQSGQYKQSLPLIISR